MEMTELILSEEVPGYSGRAFRVASGSTIAITDVEGSQIGDVFAFNADDPEEYLDAGWTRTLNQQLFPVVGEPFWTNRHRPILTLVEDRSPGAHDMLVPPCDPLFFRGMGVEDWHPSCYENFGKAAAHFGLKPALVPQPVNIFQNTRILEDRSLLFEPALTEPGDSIVFRAEMDLVLILTACSADVGGKGVAEMNRGRSTPLRVQVFA